MTLIFSSSFESLQTHCPRIHLYSMQMLIEVFSVSSSAGLMVFCMVEWWHCPRRVTALFLAVQFLHLYAFDLQRCAYSLSNCLRLWAHKAWRVGRLLLPLYLSQGPCAEPNCWVSGLVRSFSLLCGFPRFLGATPLIPSKTCYITHIIHIMFCFFAKPIMCMRVWRSLANTIRHPERW